MKTRFIHSAPTSANSIIMVVGLLAASTLPVFSQGAPNIPLPGLGGGAVASRNATPTVEESPENSNSSRFVSSDNFPDYLKKYSAVFAMSTRSYDPFGQTQDPSAKPAEVKPTITNRRPTTLKATAFSDIIGKIQINTIRPSENMFLIGTRSFKLGDSFPLSFRGKKIEVKVIGVSAKQIDFENIQSGEVASVKLSMLPPGMSSGAGGGVSAPGMVVDDSAAPLQIESPSEF